MRPPSIKDANAVSELRRSARYDTHLNAQVRNSWQEQCSALVTNISSEGLRLEGGRELVDIIFPNYATPDSAASSVVSLRLALEEAVRVSDSNSVEIHCCSVYVLRQKPDWFQIGLCYEAIDKQVAARMEAFVVELQSSLGDSRG